MYRVYQKSTDLTMDYHVNGSINRTYENMGNHSLKTSDWDLGHVTFTTDQDVNLGLWFDKDANPTAELRVDLKLNIKDYGIYFLDQDNKETGEHTLYSLKDNGIQVEAGREFGVYYIADTDYSDKKTVYNQGYDRTDVQNKLVTTTENWVASYDKAKEEEPHLIDGATWYSNEPVKNASAFFCLFQGPYEAFVEGVTTQGAYLEWEHVEFGFVTGEPVSGQPLPGTLATLLISGLCAAGLRKRNKK